MEKDIRNVEFLARAKCEDCDGLGYIPHPSWVAYHNRPDPEPMSDSEIIKWFDDRGLLSDMPFCDSVMGIFVPHLKVLPLEEIDCPRCKGKGWRNTWVTIEIKSINERDLMVMTKENLDKRIEKDNSKRHTLERRRKR